MNTQTTPLFTSYMFTFMVNLTVSCRTTDGDDRLLSSQERYCKTEQDGFSCSWNWRQQGKTQSNSCDKDVAGCFSVTIKVIIKMTSVLWNIKPHWDLIIINYHTHLFLHCNLWKTVFTSELMVDNSQQVYWCRSTNWNHILKTCKIYYPNLNLSNTFSENRNKLIDSVSLCELEVKLWRVFYNFLTFVETNDPNVNQDDDPSTTHIRCSITVHINVNTGYHVVLINSSDFIWIQSVNIQ